MSRFAKFLKESRIKLGFKSARAFYQHLEKKIKPNFNYPYYARMEAGKSLPSHLVVQKISLIYPPFIADQLILIYCQMLFEKKGYLFQSTNIPSEIKKTEGELKPQLSATSSSGMSKKQVTLDQKQIGILLKTRMHYFIFLILTLSRKPVKLSELKKIFTGTSIRSTVQDLVDQQLAWIIHKEISALDHEVKFPSAENSSLKKNYEQLDQWDREFARAMKFQSLQKKMLLRRISPRYLDLILKHAELLIGLVQSSEEVESYHNEDVISLRLTVSKGNLPG